MNTAARVEQVCRETGRMLVASKAFLDGCELPPTARAGSLGENALRGIAEPMELFAIERPRMQASPALAIRSFEAAGLANRVPQEKEGTLGFVTEKQ